MVEGILARTLVLGGNARHICLRGRGARERSARDHDASARIFVGRAVDVGQRVGAQPGSVDVDHPRAATNASGAEVSSAAGSSSTAAATL